VRNWGDELTAEKMKKCVWLRPEAVAQVEFLEWTGFFVPKTSAVSSTGAVS
jgi:hypothetical protein